MLQYISAQYNHITSHNYTNKQLSHHRRTSSCTSCLLLDYTTLYGNTVLHDYIPLPSTLITIITQYINRTQFSQCMQCHNNYCSTDYYTVRCCNQTICHQCIDYTIQQCIQCHTVQCYNNSCPSPCYIYTCLACCQSICNVCSNNTKPNTRNNVTQCMCGLLAHHYEIT